MPLPRWKDLNFPSFNSWVICSLPCLFWISTAAISVIFAVIISPFLYIIGGRILVKKALIRIADTVWGYMIRCFENWGRTEMVYSGDKLPVEETAIVIANHRWFLDWLIIFCLAARKGRMGCCKFFAKSSIRFIPGIGWGIYIMDYIFLSRNWYNDIKKITSTFYNLNNSGLPFWIVSHLEGTRFAQKKKEASQAFAKKRDLPVLENVLLPRTKGFVATVQGLRENKNVKAVYDLTIVYRDGRHDPVLADVVLRRGGRVNVHVRRYPIESIPNSEEEMTKWLYERWIEKDKLIEYLLKEGEFPQRYEDPFVHIPVSI